MSEDGSQAKADQLRKGAWLARSFTLSTIQRFNESRGDSLIIRRRGFFGYKKR
jgi:hypothetical protein